MKKNVSYQENFYVKIKNKILEPLGICLRKFRKFYDPFTGSMNKSMLK